LGLWLLPKCRNLAQLYQLPIKRLVALNSVIVNGMQRNAAVGRDDERVGCGAYCKVVQEVEEREGVKLQLSLLDELKGDDSSKKEEDAEAGKPHVRIDEAYALHTHGPSCTMLALVPVL